MEYILAKQLKDNGFPQTYNSNCEVYDTDENIHFFHIEEDGMYLDDDIISVPSQDWIKIPSITDLVQACGDSYPNLIINENGWCVGEFNSKTSPKEAIANFWLNNK